LGEDWPLSSYAITGDFPHRDYAEKGEGGARRIAWNGKRFFGLTDFDFSDR
jgi:hypothetical protein